jgi:WD40 repeat protein/serine/threonine protein kinase
MSRSKDLNSPDRLEELLERVLEMELHERGPFLDRVCLDDPELRKRVEAVLAAEGMRGRFMDEPTAHQEIFPDGPQDAAIGSMIGPYKILQEIGEGGYGLVYLAEQREPVNRRVALKVIKLGMDTRQVIARFEAERQALAMMDHPNIAKVFDAGATDNGRPFFVMELVRGVAITEYCDQCKLPTGKRLQLFTHVCRAVHHAHQKGIIHRDLKPSNILVTLHDGVPVPKVIDFGIAKATNVRLTEKTLFTDFRQFVGTPAYTSPEQMEMSGLDVDTRSDVYSLGVLLYELLTGTTPVDMATLKEAAYAEIQRTIVETEPPRPSMRVSTLTNERQLEVAAARAELPGKLPKLLRGELDWIAMKALEKERARRYESASAMAQDVDRFLENEPVQAVAPSIVYRLQKFARRNRAATAVMAAILIGSLVSLVFGIIAVRASQLKDAARLEAEGSEGEARRNLYIADMNVVQGALEIGNMERALTLLEGHIPTGDEVDLRHFEWHYHWGQAHRELFNLLADDHPDDGTKPDPIWDLALSPDSGLLASAGRNGKIRIWDLARMEERFQFSILAGKFAWVDISPNGQHLVASGEDWTLERPNVVIWNLREQKETHRFTIAPSKSPANPQFVSDGTVCVGGSDGNLWFLDLDTKEARSVKGHDASIVGVDYNIGADRLVTTSDDNWIHVWDPEEPTPVTSIELPEPKKRGLARLSPDGRLIASMRLFEGNVDIIEVESQRRMATLQSNHPNNGTRFNHEGSLVVSSEINGAIRLFATEDWREVTRYYHRSHQLNDITISDDDSLIVSGGDNGLITGWPGTETARGILRSAGWMVTSVQYSPDGRILAVGCDDGRVELWDAASEILLHTIPAQVPGGMPQPDYSDDFFAFSPDSRQLAVAQIKRKLADESTTFSVDLWDLDRFTLEASLPHPVRAHVAAYAPEGTFLATGTEADAEAVYLWDLESGEVIRTLSVANVMCMAVSPDASFMAIEGVGDHGIEIWDTRQGERVATLTEHIEPAGDNMSLLFSPDGKMLASAGYDWRVLLWDTETWEMKGELLGHRALLIDLEFSPDGKRIASSAFDNRCRLWDVASGREVANFPGYAVDFSPDGKALAAGGRQISNLEDANARMSTVRIYRASTSKPLISK